MGRQLVAGALSCVLAFGVHGSARGEGKPPKKYDGPTISPCEGTRYDVLSTTERVRPHPILCGTHGETPVGVNARFRIERRAYHTCVDGKVVKRWHETVEKFVRCEPP